MTIGASIAFFVLAVAALISALVVITHKNPIVSAVALAFHLCTISGLYFLLNAEFLALLQVIVYAGAILVLILFVLMLLNLSNELKGRPSGPLQKTMGATLAIVFGLLLVRAVLSSQGRFSAGPEDYGTVESIGRSLYGTYFYPFEVVSLLLIVAMVGAVLLAKRKV